MKKTLSLILVAALAAGTVGIGTGCSSSSSQSASSGSAANAPVKLSIMWWGTEARHTATEKVLKMYSQKHPNVTFNYTPLGWNGYEAKMSTMAAGGTLPDIIQTDYGFIDKFTKNSSLADLSSYVSDKTIDLSDVDSTLADTGKLQNKFTAVVISEGAPAVAYNEDVLKKVGLPMPTGKWTWDDFVSQCTTVQKKTGGYGALALWGMNDTDGRNLNLYLRQFGESLFSADGTKLGYTDDSHFVNYINLIKKLVDAKASPNPDQEAQLETKSKDQYPIVSAGASFMFDNLNYPVLAAKSNPGLQVTLYPSDPSGKQANYLKPGMFFSVSNNSQHKKDAAEFINYFINDVDANKTINAERGVPVSSKVRAAMKDGLSAQAKVMFDYVELVAKNCSKISPPDPDGAAEVADDLNKEISKVLYGKETAQQASTNFRQAATQVLAKNSAS